MTLQNLISDLGYDVRSYSGRGMFGKTCLGVEVDDLLGFAYDLGEAVTEFNASDEPITIPKQRMLYDNLGRGYIVYFPRVEYHSVTGV